MFTYLTWRTFESVYMKFKNILSCFKNNMYSYKSWSYFNFEYVPSLLHIEILWTFLCFCVLLSY